MDRIKKHGVLEKLQRDKRNLTKLLDDQLGTPCEQIRHQQEVERLQVEIADYKRLIGGLEQMIKSFHGCSVLGTWRPIGTRRSDLVRAAAAIVAEIERMDHSSGSVCQTTEIEGESAAEKGFYGDD